ncbi:hypothetical protein NRIC_01350 [Enterococcus florum]|uniref:Uncharacterized protein n=1 Tax=Enterococcus florum TaxID=2480627 RepID=A0A4P5P7Q0_9ENTE|nr:hypothetical protein [Enterococcus florum]GCF92244.1 hypothetical protein NRIC_01350 [Enterococcus florum]
MEKLTSADQVYRDRLIRKNRWYGLVVLVLLFSMLFLRFGIQLFELSIQEHGKDFLSGLFSAIILTFVIFIFRNTRIMNNPKMLRKARIESTDERTQNIVLRAQSIATYFLTASLVVASVIGSFFDPLLLKVSSGLLYLFGLIYMVSYFYYRKKM